MDITDNFRSSERYLNIPSMRYSKRLIFRHVGEDFFFLFLVLQLDMR